MLIEPFLLMFFGRLFAALLIATSDHARLGTYRVLSI